MRKILTTILLVGLVSICTSQETKFSIIAGYSNAFEKVKVKAVSLELGYVDDISFNGEEIEFNESYSGFYAGLSTETFVSTKLFFNPSLIYLHINETSFLQAPIFMKYYLNKDLSLIGGPQLTYTLDKVFEQIRKLNIGVGAGVSYDFSEQFFIQANYTFQLNDYVKVEDFKDKIDFLNIGLGYRF